MYLCHLQRYCCNSYSVSSALDCNQKVKADNVFKTGLSLLTDISVKEVGFFFGFFFKSWVLS